MPLASRFSQIGTCLRVNSCNLRFFKICITCTWTFSTGFSTRFWMPGITTQWRSAEAAFVNTRGLCWNKETMSSQIDRHKELVVSMFHIKARLHLQFLLRLISSVIFFFRWMWTSKKLWIHWCTLIQWTQSIYHPRTQGRFIYLER